MHNFMKAHEIENLVGAFSLALSDAILLSTQDKAPKAGPAAEALAVVGHIPGVTIERLRRALRLSHPGAVRLVDRLVTHGFLERKQCETDRRAVELNLTPSGRMTCASILEARQERIAHALEILEPQECEALGLLAGKILHRLVQERPHRDSACRLCDPIACANCTANCGTSAKP